MKLSRLIQENKVRKDRTLNQQIDTAASTNVRWLIVGSMSALLVSGYFHLIHLGLKSMVYLSILPLVTLLSVILFLFAQSSHYPRGPQKWRRYFVWLLGVYVCVLSLYSGVSWLFFESLGMGAFVLFAWNVFLSLYLSHLLAAYVMANFSIMAANWIPALCLVAASPMDEQLGMLVLHTISFVTFLFYAKHQSNLYWENCESVFLLQQKLVSVEAFYKEDAAESLLTTRGLLTITQSLKYGVSNVFAGMTLLQERTADAKSESIIKSSMAAIHMLLKQLNGLIDYAGLVSGDAGIQRAYCNLVENLKPQFKELSRYARERHIDFNIIVRPGFPSRVYVDSERAIDAIFLLLMEVVSQCKSGSILAVLDFEPLSGTQGHLTLTVHDAQANNISLQDAENKTSPSYGKLANEFTISRELVELQGGSICVYGRAEQQIVYVLKLLTSEKSVIITSPYTADKFPKADMLFVDVPAFMHDHIRDQAKTWGSSVGYEMLTDLPSISDWLEKNNDNRTKILIIYLAQDQKIVTSSTSISPIIVGHDCMCIFVVDQIQVEEYVTGKYAPPMNIKLVEKPLDMTDIYSTIIRKQNNIDIGQLLKAEDSVQQYPQCGKILVVEDQRVNQMVAAGMLKKMGYTACLANNGEEALVLLENEEFDLILMDCQMAGMDGFSATEAIREKEKTSAELKHIPIVALTAHSAAEDQTRCMAVGMDDCLTKPVKYAELAGSLRRWLGSSDHDKRLN